MQRQLSIYLDLMRLLAALAVFFAHSGGFLHPLGPLSRNGGEAVACFFVLSGFVITFVVKNKENRLIDYVVARCARIYPVAVVALIATFVVDSIGIHFAAANYHGHEYFSADYLQSLFWNLSFLNEAWGRHAVFGSNEPYWSLGFEIPYYVFFAILIFGSGYVRVAGVALFAIVIGPKVLMYLPLWLFGVAGYIACRKLADAPKSWLKGSAALLASAVAYPLIRHFFGKVHAIQMEGGDSFSTFLYFHLIGLAVLLNIVGFSLLPTIPGFARFEKAIRWAAGGSFTLYLTHQPVLLMLKSVSGPGALTLAHALGLMAAALVICYVLAEVAERRKVIYRDMFRTLFRYRAATVR